MNTHVCIMPGCGTSYQDTEPEAYYCSSCTEKKKEVAARIDETLKSVPRKQTKSDWQIYQEAPKIHGFPDAKHFL